MARIDIKFDDNRNCMIILYEGEKWATSDDGWAGAQRTVAINPALNNDDIVVEHFSDGVHVATVLQTRINMLRAVPATCDCGSCDYHRRRMRPVRKLVSAQILAMSHIPEWVD